MKVHKKLVEVYQEIIRFIRTKEFNSTWARRLIGLYRDWVDGDDTRTTPGAVFMEARDEHLRGDDPKPQMTCLAETAFAGLAAHLRDPDARKVVSDLIELAGANASDTLFIRVQNVRPLDSRDKQHGPAAITVVVNDAAVFNELVSSPARDRVRNIYWSFADGAFDDTAIVVDRASEVLYPEGTKRVLHADYQPVGPAKYDLTDLVLELPESSVEWDKVPGHRVYRHLLNTHTICTCLDIRDGREIAKKDVATFRRVFGDSKVWLWKSAVEDAQGQINVPFLSVVNGTIQMRGYTICAGADDEVSLKLKDCIAPRFVR